VSNWSDAVVATAAIQRRRPVDTFMYIDWEAWSWFCAESLNLRTFEAAVIAKKDPKAVARWFEERPELCSDELTPGYYFEHIHLVVVLAAEGKPGGNPTARNMLALWRRMLSALALAGMQGRVTGSYLENGCEKLILPAHWYALLANPTISDPNGLEPWLGVVLRNVNLIIMAETPTTEEAAPSELDLALPAIETTEEGICELGSIARVLPVRDMRIQTAQEISATNAQEVSSTGTTLNAESLVPPAQSSSHLKTSRPTKAEVEAFVVEYKATAASPSQIGAIRKAKATNFRARHKDIKDAYGPNRVGRPQKMKS
jgi:hypothetical protein